MAAQEGPARAKDEGHARLEVEEALAEPQEALTAALGGGYKGRVRQGSRPSRPGLRPREPRRERGKPWEPRQRTRSRPLLPWERVVQSGE